jgi:isoaspartyl peptidase/L-asparaginase-like protein (Ntn-hydrolase superfamily)
MFIAVHAGAGWHSPSTRTSLSTLMRAACHHAITICRNRIADGNPIMNPTEAVIAAIAYMEASPLTNAANGSCLTINGTVECDVCGYFTLLFIELANQHIIYIQSLLCSQCIGIDYDR